LGERIVAASPLETLLADYKAYELPLPPAEAELSVVGRRIVSIRNNVRTQGGHLVFLVKKAAGGEPAVYWAGCDAVRAWHNAKFSAVAPRAASLNETTPLAPECWKDRGFPTCPDLALAVQCYAQGWKDLAEALLERSRKRQEEGPFQRRRPRAEDDRVALAELAWNHYCKVFSA
jgi:hypothetical protein